MTARLLLTVLLSLALAAPAFAGDPGPNIEDLSGNAVASDSIHNDGKPMLVVFWATWDSPSKRALNTVHEGYEAWTKQGFKLVIVSIDDVRNKHKVKPYVDSKGWGYEAYIDPGQALAKKMGVDNPPQAFVMDGKKNITKTFQGFVDGDEAKWEAALKAAK